MSGRKLKELSGQLIGPMTAIARAMSRNYDVTIIPSGFECCTDGSVIKYPFNADYLQDVDQKIVHGILDHEVAHIAEEREHTEAGQERPLAIMRRQPSSRHKMMLNVFEDIRIESKKSKEYPGVAENLDAANKNSVDIWRKKCDSGLGDANFWHTMGAAIILKALGHDTSWLPSRYSPFLDTVEDEISRSNWPVCCWASDSEKLAHSAIRKIEELAQDILDEVEENEDTNRDKGEGEPSEGDRNDEDGDGEAEREDAEGVIKEAQKALSEDSDSTDLSSESKSDIIDSAKAEAAGSGRYIPHPWALERDKETRPGGNLTDYNVCKNRVQQQISALRSKLLAVIRTRSASNWVGDMDEGDVDDGSLAAARFGHRRIFSQEIKGETLDTAVSILVDLSGSMGPGKIEDTCSWHAKHMLIALAETLNSLGIPFEAIGFQNGCGEARGCASDGAVEYSRLEPFEWRIFKSFAEKHRKVRHRYSTVSGTGNNADGEAVLFTARRLAKRKESRKIMFVLSDGAPCAEGNHEHLVKNLHDSVKLSTSAGIEVLGIGANTRSVAKFYSKKNGADHVIIDNLDQLAVRVYKMMRTRLLQHRRAP